ncbi:hypothetical protein SK128_028583 [Halocaridina rubra]|uniref:Uncharacterized protein n=1 Tax=Halocaridina rubra TaxID=373956 RepID=A0AAN8X7Y6_HALRR
MENGGDSAENSTTPKADSTKKDDPDKKEGDPTPVYSREVTLQAHFTFGTPSMAPVQYAHVTPTSTSSLSGRPLMASGGPSEHWQWTGDGAATGAQCSITCGREGLTMTYNAQPTSNIRGVPLVPCTICDSLVAAHPDHVTTITTTTTTSTTLPGTVASLPITTCVSATPSSPTFTRSLMDLSRPQEQPTARSLTFSGSLDRATQRPTQQRPYGRRCKSTAHIILQNNEMPGTKEMRPHEFHSTIREGDVPPIPEEGRPSSEPRGRARHRGVPESRYSGVGTFASSGWERLHTVTEEQEQSRRSHFEGGLPSVPPVPPLLPPCCPCHHCTALYTFMSSLAHERTYHTCGHHHHHHHPHHHCSQPHSHSQGQPTHPFTHSEESRVPPPKSPTSRTFNSHKCYEEEQGPLRRHDQRGAGPSTSTVPSHAQRLAPPVDQQGKARTPSPGTRPRPPPLPESPESSPSPEGPRTVRGLEQQQPHTTPRLPRRVPRMGAAAAAAAASTAAAPASYSAVQVHNCVLCTKPRATQFSLCLCLRKCRMILLVDQTNDWQLVH